MPKHINPSYHKKATRTYSLEECKALIREDRQVLSQLISRSESNLEEDRKFLAEIFDSVPRRTDVKRIAITGAPGVGKSSFLNTFCKFLLDKGYKVAVLPVDPTSYGTRGSILGDKTRMDHLVGIEDVYIKPMASALALGGVAPATAPAICLCEMAGFDYIFVETVGVGQSEYEVRALVDLFILLLQPGGGDELQGIKRGIMEMADLLIINKADGELKPIAEISLKNYSSANKLFSVNDSAWKTKCTLYSSVTDEYLEKTYELVQAYFDFMMNEGRLTALRNQQEVESFQQGIKSLLFTRMSRRPEVQNKMSILSSLISEGKLSHLQALNQVETLLDEVDG